MDKDNADKKYQRLDSVVEKFTKKNIDTICLKYQKTGFSGLDEVLGGGLCAGINVLGAVSGLGKSTFALQMAEEISKAGTPVLYFSLEMPKERIAAKAISRRWFKESIESGDDKNCEITASMLTNAEKIKEIDWKKLGTIRSKVKKDSENLYIIERQEENISAKKIVETVNDFMKDFTKDEKDKQPVVMVDYLQILAPESEDFRGTDKQNVDESIRQLTALANMKKVPILLISSLNRSGYTGSVQIQNLKESGSIEYSADVVLGLQFRAEGTKRKGNEIEIDINEEKNKSPREVEIVVLKQRYGTSGSDASVKFDYYAEHDCFKEKREESELARLPIEEL